MNKVILSAILIIIRTQLTFAQTDTTGNRVDTSVIPVRSTDRPPIPADSTEKKSKFLKFSGFTLMTDQDIFTGSRNQDRNYTMGVGILFTSFKPDPKKIFINKNFLILPWFRKMLDLNCLLGKKDNDPLKNYAFELRFSAFTPYEIEKAGVVEGDRPFAVVFNAGSTRQSTFNPGVGKLREQYSYTTSFYLGILGTQIGDWFQTTAHKNHWFGSTRPLPLGWHNQISNKKYFPPVFLYRVSYMKPAFNLPASPDCDYRYFQLSANLETNLGYYTNLAGGLNFRAGAILDDYYQSQNTGSGFVAQKQVTRQKIRKQLYFFANVRGRLVGYNTLLQGRLINDSSVYTLRTGEISRTLLELEWGVMASVGFFRLAIVPLSLRTSELRTSYSRTHYWGTVYISFSGI